MLYLLEGEGVGLVGSEQGATRGPGRIKKRLSYFYESPRFEFNKADYLLR